MTPYLSKIAKYVDYYSRLVSAPLELAWNYGKNQNYKNGGNSRTRRFVFAVNQTFQPGLMTANDVATVCDRIGEGSLTKLQYIVGQLMIPIGFENRVFGTDGNTSHHRARLSMVQTRLPRATNVLDLGGSSACHKEGALLAMGYPHQPQSVSIVDQPWDERQKFYGERQWQDQDDPSSNTTDLRFYYQSMTDLSRFEDGEFDLVWSGQSIEHIPREEVSSLVEQIQRVLKPGGYFCLDTPNRLLTKLIHPRSYIHPEHFYEYAPSELAEIIEESGLGVESTASVSPLPVSRRVGRLQKWELIRSDGLGGDPDDGYSFFLCCRKMQDSVSPAGSEIVEVTKN